METTTKNLKEGVTVKNVEDDLSVELVIDNLKWGSIFKSPAYYLEILQEVRESLLYILNNGKLTLEKNQNFTTTLSDRYYTYYNETKSTGTKYFLEITISYLNQTWIWKSTKDLNKMEDVFNTIRKFNLDKIILKGTLILNQNKGELRND